MTIGIFDISTAFIALTMAVILVSVKMPYDRQWKAMRRMNWLLFACYTCMGISNLVTGLLGVADQENSVMWLAMLLVSMYQALLFTATCITFISPHRANVKWLLLNTAFITIVSIVSIYTFCCNEKLSKELGGIDAVIYSALLIYYCRLFKKAYNEGRQQLEVSYDEDMSANLRWITRCFISALTVGISALLFAVLRLGAVEYIVFTCLYTLYYVYLVICVINYRISAGFIVKVVAADTPSKAEESTSVGEIDSKAEMQLQSAIEKWVKEKRYVQNDQTVEEIATELGTTHAMLKWYFTNRMHTTFRTWRLNFRVTEAKRLLSEEDTPVAMVHKMVGVADKSNFHKLFCKQVGMTPREFKENARLK